MGWLGWCVHVRVCVLEGRGLGRRGQGHGDERKEMKDGRETEDEKREKREKSEENEDELMGRLWRSRDGG